MNLSRSEKKAGRGYHELIDLGILEIEPLTYIRGRSIPNQFIIVDEAQNLTPHEVKTIITRVGDGTKIVLTGDPYQIDNPYVDQTNNGLVHVVNRFKQEQLAGHMTCPRASGRRWPSWRRTCSEARLRGQGAGRGQHARSRARVEQLDAARAIRRAVSFSRQPSASPPTWQRHGALEADRHPVGVEVEEARVLRTRPTRSCGPGGAAWARGSGWPPGAASCRRGASAKGKARSPRP